MHPLMHSDTLSQSKYDSGMLALNAGVLKHRQHNTENTPPCQMAAFDFIYIFLSPTFVVVNAEFVIHNICIYYIKFCMWVQSQIKTGILIQYPGRPQLSPQSLSARNIFLQSRLRVLGKNTTVLQLSQSDQCGISQIHRQISTMDIQ